MDALKEASRVLASDLELGKRALIVGELGSERAKEGS